MKRMIEIIINNFTRQHEYVYAQCAFMHSECARVSECGGAFCSIFILECAFVILYQPFHCSNDFPTVTNLQLKTTNNVTLEFHIKNCILWVGKYLHPWYDYKFNENNNRIKRSFTILSMVHTKCHLLWMFWYI